MAFSLAIFDWSWNISWKPVLVDSKRQLLSFRGSKDQVGLSENGGWT